MLEQPEQQEDSSSSDGGLFGGLFTTAGLQRLLLSSSSSSSLLLLDPITVAASAAAGHQQDANSNNGSSNIFTSPNRIDNLGAYEDADPAMISMIVNLVQTIQSKLNSSSSFSDDYNGTLSSLSSSSTGTSAIMDNFFSLNSSSITNNNSSLSSATQPSLPTSNELSGLWSVLMITVGILLSLITGGMNLMVMISFKIDRQLQTISNYFLFSLAVADAMIGFISIPFLSVYIVDGEWKLGYTTCLFWLSTDYLMSNASVYNLLLISFDRYFSVTRPLTYRPRRTTRKALIMIASTYVISLILWPPWIIAWPYIEGEFKVPSNACYVQFLSTNVPVTIGTIMAAFYFPVGIIVVLYARVYYETQKRQKQFGALQACQQRSLYGKKPVINNNNNNNNASSATSGLGASNPHPQPSRQVSQMTIQSEPGYRAKREVPPARDNNSSTIGAEGMTITAAAATAAAKPSKLPAFRQLLDFIGPKLTKNGKSKTGRDKRGETVISNHRVSAMRTSCDDDDEDDATSSFDDTLIRGEDSGIDSRLSRDASYRRSYRGVRETPAGCRMVVSGGGGESMPMLPGGGGGSSSSYAARGPQTILREYQLLKETEEMKKAQLAQKAMEAATLNSSTPKTIGDEITSTTIITTISNPRASMTSPVKITGASPAGLGPPNRTNTGNKQDSTGLTTALTPLTPVTEQSDLSGSSTIHSFLHQNQNPKQSPGSGDSSGCDYTVLIQLDHPHGHRGSLVDNDGTTEPSGSGSSPVISKIRRKSQPTPLITLIEEDLTADDVHQRTTTNNNASTGPIVEHDESSKSPKINSSGNTDVLDQIVKAEKGDHRSSIIGSSEPCSTSNKPATGVVVLDMDSSSHSTPALSRTSSAPTPNKPLVPKGGATMIRTGDEETEGGSNRGGGAFGKRRKRKRGDKDSKAAKTLSAILAVFVVTWMPYSVFVVIESFQKGTIPENWWTFSYYLCYINSTLNPLCYALCNPNFRRTYLRILKCRCSRKHDYRPAAGHRGGALMAAAHLQTTGGNNNNNNSTGGGGAGGGFYSNNNTTTNNNSRAAGTGFNKR